VGGGAYWYFAIRSGAAAPASSVGFDQVVTAQRGDLSASISVVGELYAVQSADLAFDRLSGSTPLLTMNAVAGNQVQAGEVLATIDPTPYQQALDQAQGALQSAEETLRELQTPPTDLQLARADLAVAKANLDLEKAQKALAEALQPDVADLRLAVEEATTSLRQAEIQRSLTETDTQAKTLRDLAYSVGWLQRREAELQDLVGGGKANLEQTEELASVRAELSSSSVTLGVVQSQREVSLKAADASVAAAEVSLMEAEERLRDAEIGDALAQAKARLAVQQAEVVLQGATEDRRNLASGADASKLAAAQAEFDKRRLAVSEAEADLAGATITAPFDGTILKTGARSGGLVSGSTVIASVANLDHLEVLAAIDETIIRQVEPGMTAEITLDAFPGKSFTGRVLSVPLQGSLQSGITVYSVPVSLEGAEDLTLLIGMTANLTIRTGQVQNALLIPALAVLTVGGYTQVLVPSGSATDSEPVSTPVEVGLSNGVYTQIVRGLNDGDQVVVQLQTASSPQFRMGGNMGMLGGAVRAGGQ
jgi:HlyD family secretion protein